MVCVKLTLGERVPVTRFVCSRLYKFLLLCLVSSTFGYDDVLAEGSNNGTVELGSVLRPSEQLMLWYSTERKFGLGFHPSGNDGLYVLGIAYSDIKDPALVWSAGSGIQIGVQSSFRLDNNGNLVLQDEIGRVLWQSNTGNSGVVSAVLEDNGNFVLKNGNSTVVWDTFTNPTDTLLVGQKLAVGRRLELYPYSFSLEPYGNLTLKWKGNITYWNVGASESSKTLTASLSNEGLFAISNSSGAQLWVTRSSDYTDNSTTLRRIKLDPDGNLRSYGWHENSQSWHVGWSAVEDQCLVYGWCGNFGMCVYNDTGPTCTCPSANFVAVDPKDPQQGCKREPDIDIQECSNNQSMLELEHTEFLSYPPESDDFYGGISDCEENCAKSGSCIAATILNDGSGMCRFKTTNFTSAYQSITIPSTSYIKVCGEPQRVPSSTMPVAPSSRSIKVSVAGIVVAVVGTLLFLAIIETAIWWFFCRNNSGGLSAQYTLLDYASGAPVQFSYEELKRSTKNFKEKVGSGGFGTVYKGTMPNRSLVAVKKLEGIEQGDKQFRMEVATISSTHHLNLVRLIGFCSEGRHRLLVYEFMKNTSLDVFLFPSSEKSRILDWETRLNIALGTARGIAYLHEECRDCIIHCDIKPENILLDDNLNAKVSDFGLAKLNNVRDHRNHTLNSIRGTRGYLAPEWLANLPITSKSDVFSYGMVLLEIISGKRNFDISVTSGRRKFSTWAFDEFEKGNILNIIDEKLGGQINAEQVERAIQVSFWCIQEQPSQRPSMGKVVKMLEGLLPIEKPPAPKPFEGLQSSASINCSVSASGSMVSVLAASAPPASSSSSADVFLS
ncbi:hypothetical protein SUGI_0231080 [Cryptomeria japonica]|uniref:G-type lectin S-receptor-like serine/threonine-protein kinase At1g34300 n=1 Tax=Cryptomeria japonica TaxID=3369 RepID=UPI002408E3E6|nr:G-type lectin S-receptor-like serine/threonine-protein kinase At1g34300 [Cryptomeria japonica]XP_057869042.2 G-type lectin S-receptor-like serine/threonine-protein kinase At1g34300 [Cryptomeria japonica]XP_057869043.2 G-type lectin S-receptor-like serine/threonine-protein kinase At1g34300 [Cryptomeria japonica]GLJ14333.1 hypothetical protein SUGI_0231080 [Cryptomeria japonica]